MSIIKFLNVVHVLRLYLIVPTNMIRSVIGFHFLLGYAG